MRHPQNLKKSHFMKRVNKMCVKHEILVLCMQLQEKNVIRFNCYNTVLKVNSDIVVFTNIIQ